MQTGDLIIVSVLTSLVCALITACWLLCARMVRGNTNVPREKGLRAWWNRYKPSKRRLIQVYAALLCNANLRGFAAGTIYSGNTKYLCTPGLNCYSCPGATGACPLGSLQNALASSETRAPYYVIGILMLYGLILGRTICGFLCPFGLGQDLVYKIKTPKLKKSKITRVCSYLKYVILAVFVIALPLMYAGVMKIPAFCKYICPAGTLGGAVGLLVNPRNADLFGMLHGLFTWKFIVLAVVFVACIFIYRFFCRFLCPLGALYGLFNRIALLGVKLDRNKCTECGLCLSRCKLDIKHVGDHECIQCGECIDVCPAKAISWKGSRLFVHASAVEAPVPAEKPLGALLSATESPSQSVAAESPAASVSAPHMEETAQKTERKTRTRGREKRSGKFWAQAAAWAAALALLAGALIYYNLIAAPSAPVIGTEYTFTVNRLSGTPGTVAFSISEEGEPVSGPADVQAGDGSAQTPYILAELSGSYEVEIPADASGASADVYFVYTASEDATYTILSDDDELKFDLFYQSAEGHTTVAAISGKEQRIFELAARPENLPAYGNGVGELCYDFSLPAYGDRGTFRLSAHRGKIVLINFWYTTCGPCVEEMPIFDDLAERYADVLDVVAIHSSNITANPATTEGVQKWLDSTTFIGKTRIWSQSRITFAQDYGVRLDSKTYLLLGGKGPYPMTLVVDPDGVIAYVKQGSITAQGLESEIQSILARK